TVVRGPYILIIGARSRLAPDDLHLSNAPGVAPGGFRRRAVLHGPPLRSGRLLRRVQLLGKYQDVVRLPATGLGPEDRGVLFFPPPQRSVRALSRPPPSVHQSPRAGVLPGGAAPQGKHHR